MKCCPFAVNSVIIVILCLILKKTVCIKFGDKLNEFENVYMNNTLVQWANEVKHLGNIVQSSLSDDGDCRFKRSMFIGYVNKLISKFGHLQPDVLINLFNNLLLFFLWIEFVALAFVWFQKLSHSLEYWCTKGFKYSV